MRVINWSLEFSNTENSKMILSRQENSTGHRIDFTDMQDYLCICCSHRHKPGFIRAGSDKLRFICVDALRPNQQVSLMLGRFMC